VYRIKKWVEEKETPAPHSLTSGFRTKNNFMKILAVAGKSRNGELEKRNVITREGRTPALVILDISLRGLKKKREGE